MSTLRTFNLQNPDSGTVNIEMDQGGNTLMTGIATVRGAAHFTSTSGSDAVGIGTDITAYKLDVRVTGAEAGLRVYNPDTSSNASGILRLGNDDNQNSAFLKLNGANNSSTVGGAANLVLGTGTARQVHLATNGASRFAVRSDGKISAGTLLDTNNSYEFSIRGADDTGCLYAHGRNHYLSTRSTSHSSLTLKKSNSDSDGVDYLQLRDSSNTGKFIINGDGTLQIVDSINHLGDTNTKIRFPAADTITAETGGSERLRITSDGNVLIGTNTGTEKLCIKRDDAVGPTITLENNSIKTYINNWGSSGPSGRTNRFEINATVQAQASICAPYITLMTGGAGDSHEKVRITSGGDVGINETSPDTTLHISRSASQNDTHGILKVESTSTGTGAATNASLITKNRYGWSQFMQWEEHGLRIGSRSTTTGGDGKVTVTYGSDSTGAVINENGVVTMPQQCGFHVVLHTSQTLSNNGMVNLWDTDASDSRSYIKNMTFNAGRFVAPVSGLYYFTAQLLLSGVASSDDSIHIAWTTGSGNDTFAYWNTRHDGASANGSYGYGGYLPVTGSTTVYLAANAIFGIRANFTGGIGIHGTDANWGHWSGFLVG